jgi:hypothetical protein
MGVKSKGFVVPATNGADSSNKQDRIYTDDEKDARCHSAGEQFGGDGKAREGFRGRQDTGAHSGRRRPYGDMSDDEPLETQSRRVCKDAEATKP